MKSSAIPSAPSEFPTTTTQEPTTSKLEITTFANENVEPAKDLNQLAIPLVPRVVLPQDEEEEEEAAADDDLDRPKLFPDTLHFSLPENLNKKIAQLSEFNLAQEQVPFEVIQGSGVSVTENSVIPERGNGEFITLYVGHHSRKEMRYAITKKRDSVIRGPNDSNIDVSSNFNLKFDDFSKFWLFLDLVRQLLRIPVHPLHRSFEPCSASLPRRNAPRLPWRSKWDSSLHLSRNGRFRQLQANQIARLRTTNDITHPSTKGQLQVQPTLSCCSNGNWNSLLRR